MYRPEIRRGPLNFFAATRIPLLATIFPFVRNHSTSLVPFYTLARDSGRYYPKNDARRAVCPRLHIAILERQSHPGADCSVTVTGDSSFVGCLSKSVPSRNVDHSSPFLSSSIQSSGAVDWPYSGRGSQLWAVLTRPGAPTGRENCSLLLGSRLLRTTREQGHRGQEHTDRGRF